MTPKCPARQSYSTGPSPAQSYNPGYSGGSGGANRAFPQYSVYGSESLLTIKPLLPSFKPAGGDGIALDKRGKIMLGFTPAASDGTRFLWDQQIQMALSVEEVGLIVNQLPAHPVELSRSGSQGEGGTAEGTMTGVPDKVLTISPGEGAMVTFALDYVLDGVGGQISQLDTNSVNAPMEVIAQAGEFEVSDYAGQASGLFNNMRAPASLLTGALLGATFSLSPVAGDVPWLKLLKRAPQV